MEMLENSMWLYVLAQKLALLALRPLVYMWLSLVVSKIYYFLLITDGLW